MTVLFVNACLRGDESRTLTLCREYLEGIEDVKEVNLSEMRLEPYYGDSAAYRAQLEAKGLFDDPMFDIGKDFAEADEIVIARGDLGNAMPLWELPAAQKRIEAQCRKAGKPFMVVTQMLASMEQNPVPTRAEVSDIFNAVADGAAAVMVTGETAVGKWPVEVIRYLSNTVQAAERFLREG